MASRKIKRREKGRRKIKRRETGIKRRGTFPLRKRKIIIEALENRFPIKRACQLAGISRMALHDWMEKGKDPQHYPLHAKFRKRVHKAIAQSELEALNIIRKSARGGNKVVETSVSVGPKGQETKRVWKEQLPVWQAAAWFLERRFREEYSRDATSEEKQRSADEMAREVKAAAEALFDSVPIEPDEACLPADMPD